MIIQEACKFGIWWAQELWCLAPTAVVILQGAQEQLPLKVQEDGAQPVPLDPAPGYRRGHQMLLSMAFWTGSLL